VSFPREEAEREAFLQLVQKLTAPDGALPGFFIAGAPLGVARAPGRLDVMGGIADYSGSLVLELPIAEAAFAAAQLVPEPFIRVTSVDPENRAAPRTASFERDAWLGGGYEGARRLLAAAGAEQWPGYVAGPLVPLVHELGATLAGGARVLLASTVPEGKGVSSSAAVEVASLFALARAANIELLPERAALACQKVENLIADAPCGVMDQLTAACGRRGHLLEILCQPATICGHPRLPPGLAFFGIDSGVRHAVSGASYRDVRVAAFMGYRMIISLLGVASEPSGDGACPTLTDRRFSGFLANVTPSELEQEFLARLPEAMSGAEFLATYGRTTDPVTRVEPGRSYPVRAATAHPIREHHRVRLFAELLGQATSERTRRLLGELMFESHASYAACGLGSEATDGLVRLARAAGADSGIYGAKITGGGSGGTVAILARADAEATVRGIAELHDKERGHPVVVFAGSSAGAAEFGSVLASL
jgi:galactokinase